MNMSSMQAEAYKEEVEELLVEIEETILEIEQAPEDTEPINKLFRAMHTIKGSGNMFGFNDIADFTHHVETVLDKVRDGSIQISKTLINLIFDASDHIKSMIDAAANELEVDMEKGEEIISGFKQFLTGDVDDAHTEEASPLPPPKPETYEEVTYRIRFHPDKDIFNFGTDPATIMDDLRNLGECKVVAHVKEIPALEDFTFDQCYIFWDIILTSDKGENAIKDIFIFFEDSCELNIEIIDEKYDLPDDVNYKKLGEILIEKKDISPQVLDETLGDQKKIGEKLVEANIVDSSAIESALAEQEQVQKVRKKRKEKQSQSSIRVPAERLDSLVDLVGELVTAQARLGQKAIEQNDAELTLISEEIDRLVSGLRENAMSIRMIQIGMTFSSLKRLVRDLSDELGKDIMLTTIGGETELDKTVIEQLKDPLVHIIRNSIDHGIEDPEERLEAGKPPQGTIHLSAEHEGAHVAIHIIDDGRGLDPVKIKAKAIERGVLSTDAEITEKEIYRLIFNPGFSTAKEVTDVSGRGVGMDIVKKNIESLRGSVNVESKLNKGTTITLKLPLTLAIIDGLMVTLEDEFYILPLSTVEECVELDERETNRIKGRNILNIRGEVVPYIRLREKFGLISKPPPLEHIVITEVNHQRIGFVVDNVIGGHQTVIKSLGPAFKNAQEVSGATILGDGTVALILDVNKLV